MIRGAEYYIRQLTRDDAERHRAFVARLSPASRYQRFMSTMREPTPALLGRLMDVDGHRAAAYVAARGHGASEIIIGVARYCADASGADCEFAVAVADEWQGRGIGTALMENLFAHAQRAGFVSIYGNILAGNDTMIELARHLGLTIEPQRSGEHTVRASRRLN